VAEQLVFELVAPAAATFATFVAGRNAEALAALERLAAAPGSETGVVLWGASGAGKSHLLAASVASAAAHGRAAHYLAAPAHADPALAVDGARQQPGVVLQTRVHLVPDRLHLPRVPARADDEEIRVDAHRPHVEDHDVVRQLVLGDAGDAAGLFDGVQLHSAYPREWAIQPEPLDLRGDGRRHEI